MNEQTDIAVAIVEQPRHELIGKKVYFEAPRTVPVPLGFRKGRGVNARYFGLIAGRVISATHRAVAINAAGGLYSRRYEDIVLPRDLPDFQRDHPGVLIQPGGV